MIAYRSGVRGCRQIRHALLSPLEHKAYCSWIAARNRCRSKTIKHYGADGIQMCAQWQNDFAQFVADVGLPTETHFSIDRIDSSKGYEPGNCRWATPVQQARNRKDNRWLEINGVKKLVMDWAKESGVSYQTITRRIASGITGSDLLKPAVPTGGRRAKLITINGESKTIKEWAAISGLTPVTIGDRIFAGANGAEIIAPRKKAGRPRKDGANVLVSASRLPL